MRYFEDLKRGDRFSSPFYSVTQEEIVAFSRAYDPQLFHLEIAVARQTMFAGLIASGWYTAAITMRLFVETLNFSEGAIGLGVDKLRWPNPVRPGDDLQVETRIINLRISHSKPEYGIVRLRNVTTNKKREVVQTMLASALVRRHKYKKTGKRSSLRS
jgi:acyl dehydratase